MSVRDTRTPAGEDVRRVRITVVMAALAVLLLVLAAANLCVGSLSVPLSDIPGILFGADHASSYAQVIWRIRLPRLIAAAVLGAGLALAGYLLQGLFANPIAGPYVLGISHGAKLAVALTMVAILGSAHAVASWMLMLAAFVGSLAVMALVMVVSRRVSSTSTLIVVGVMVGYICSACTDLLVTFASDSDIVNLHNWSLGSFSGTSWTDIGVMTVVVLASAACAFALSKPMAAYQLGEGYARSVGVDVRMFRIAVIVLSSMLAGCVTAFAGPISFVGVAVPHVVKRLLGTSKPLVVIPATFLGGAIFCLLCDLIARTAFAPTEVSVSTITALLGSPVVIWVLLRRTRQGASA